MIVFDLSNTTNRTLYCETDCACGEMESKQVVVKTDESNEEDMRLFTSELIFRN